MPENKIVCKPRNHYFDFLRGVAIILVIGNHTCSVANFSTSSGFNFNILLMELCKIAVPLFLAISVFFLSKKIVDSRWDYYHFLKRQLPRVYIPLIIFCLPFIFGNGLSIKSIVGRCFLTLIGYYSIYYFVFLIAQYYLLLPVIQKMMRAKISGLVICSIITAIAIVIVTYIKIIKGLNIPLCIYAGPFPVWLIFFALGCWLGIHGTAYKLKIPFILCLVGLVFSYVESIYLIDKFGDGLGIKPSVFFFSAFAIVLLFSYRIQTIYNKKVGKVIKTVLQFVGATSFFIYLGHIYLVRLIDDLGMSTSSWIFNWFIITLLCAIIAKMLIWLLPKFIHKYIGL